MKKKLLIIGGVAGGASAAARLRRLDEESEILLFERGEHISFANCGLPYYIGETIENRDNLFVVTPELMKKRFNIDVRVNSVVTSISRDKKTVDVFDRIKNEVYTEKYDKLVLAPGAEPIKPPVPGIDSERIYTLRNIPDTDRIKSYVDKEKPKHAIIIGAGFIGLEMAENLHKRGIKVTIVEMANQVIGPLDYEMASIVHQHLKIKGVEFYLSDAVTGFQDNNDFLSVTLQSGKTLKTDIVIMGIGVRPETKLAREAGLEIGKTGGILTDEYMQTSDKDIYAVGDAVEVKDYITDDKTLIPLAWPANRQGRIAADNIYGRAETYQGSMGTSIVKIFDITVAITGNNEKQLIKKGITYLKSYTHSPSHAGYYPGAIPMSVKLIFEKEKGRILGAQVVGYDGVDKRLDVIATAIKGGMTVYDLQELQLAYAPPYSSAKDPVNMAGFTASNILKGDSRVFYWDDVDTLNKEKSILIDVRTKEEYEFGSIKGSINIPLDDIRDNLNKIPKDKTVYIYCQVGLRGYLALRILKNLGYNDVLNLSGGYKTYQLAVQKQSNEDIYEYEKIEINDEIKPVSCYGSECKDTVTKTLDACSLQCPGPIIKVSQAVKELLPGQIIEVLATDPGFESDIPAWCSRTGNVLEKLDNVDNKFLARIRKGRQENTPEKSASLNKTMVIFSNDLDKAIASFIIANGAASMGRKVTLFFTFWGLNILRKPGSVKVKKDLISRMFGFMMPRGPKKLSLSQMNMLGMGGKMIRWIMKKKKVYSLEELITQAIDNGVELIACNMSMDIMGIKKEELLDEVQYGGVASYIAASEEADMSLFI
jgi:CoA-disulfide reductase